MITLDGLFSFYTMYHYVAILLLLSLFIFGRRKIVTLPFFIPFLIIHCAVELFLVYFFAKTYKNTFQLYNLFNVIVVSYYFYVYWHYFKNIKWSNFIMYSYLIWGLYTAYIFITQDTVNKLHSHYVIGLTFISVFIFLFFKSILESNVFLEIKRLPIFYFSVGILLLFFTSLPMFIFPHKLIIDPETNIIAKLVQFSNLLLNLGYLGAILCKRMI